MALNWTKTTEGYEAKANNGTETWTVERTKGGRFVLLSSFLDGVVLKGTLTDCKAHAEEASKTAFSGPDLTTPLPAEEFNELFRPEIAAAKSINDASPINAGGKKRSDPTTASRSTVDGPAATATSVPPVRPTSGGSGLASRIATQPSLKPNTDSVPHLIIEARAGTGKTTTIVEGLRFVMGGKSSMTPSLQQKAIWDAMGQSKGAMTVAVVAFNATIADELRGKVPSGVQAMTTHSMGYAACRKAFPSLKLNKFRVSDIISEVVGKAIREIRKETPLVVRAVEALVSKCKATLCPVVEADEDERHTLLTDLCDYYDIETDDEKGNYRDEVFRLVPLVLERCADVTKDNCVDFDDQIWLPITLDLPLVKYGLLCVDESQDLNRARQELVKRSGHRLMLVGDTKQAINGFTGADAESMSRMFAELSSTPKGCVTLPLTETRRCGKVIVKEANQFVSDFTAHPSNPEGKITEAKYPTQGGYENQRGEWVEKYDLPANETYLWMVTEGDMILCRVNAPLVSQCFKFIKAGKRANIQGRDVAAGLISTVKKLNAFSIPELVGKLSDWLHVEVAKEQAKRNPCEGRILALEDRADCITAFIEGSADVAEVVRKIENIFTNDQHAKGIKLSSVHRAKGTEANRVFILKARSIKCRPPKREWEAVQASNLEYVAITRAIHELVYVR